MKDNHIERRTRTIRPLAGVRVLELGNYIAAPTAGRMLADFGAEVIKVERPGTGDELRNWRLYAGDTSMLYRTINRNKKSIVLDLKTERGRAIVLDLIRRSDVLLENFRPGTLEKWGLGPEVLDERQPRTRDHPHLRRSGRPARWRHARDSPPSPRHSAGCANWSATPTGRRCGWGFRSATRSRESTPRSAP